VRSSFAPENRERAAPGPGLLNRVPVPALSCGDDQVSQVPGEPPCVHAPLSDPGELFTPGPTGRVDAAFRYPNDVGAREDCLSRLNHAACTLPVYASQGGSLRHHATLGAGWWPTSTGRDWVPAGLRRKVSEIATTSLSPFPGFAWRTKTHKGGICPDRVLPAWPSSSVTTHRTNGWAGGPGGLRAGGPGHHTGGGDGGGGPAGAPRRRRCRAPSLGAGQLQPNRSRGGERAGFGPS
jgi:hypothetical protein